MTTDRCFGFLFLQANPIDHVDRSFKQLISEINIEDTFGKVKRLLSLGRETSNYLKSETDNNETIPIRDCNNEEIDQLRMYFKSEHKKPDAVVNEINSISSIDFDSEEKNS